MVGMAVRAKKNRRTIEDIRRVELIEAAYRIFMQTGLQGLTTTRICTEAGMSQGILTYYFKNKNEVLFAMVRMANRILMDSVVVRLRSAETRWDRLLAVIEGNFPADRFDRATANAWISFYAEAARDARYHRLQRLFYRRLQSNLASALLPLVSRPELDDFGAGFAAMLDGLWIRQGHAPEPMDVEHARRLLLTYAEKALGPQLVATLKRTAPAGEVSKPVSGS
jgi:TetR/AcrR family transcriptional repressor of bet genes